jgi:hypothetical protein
VFYKAAYEALTDGNSVIYLILAPFLDATVELINSDFTISLRGLTGSSSLTSSITFYTLVGFCSIEVNSSIL